MFENEHVNEDRLDAFQNVCASINSTALLPEQVFKGNWNQFLFFETDMIFARSFPEVVTDIIRIEQAKCCCLLNYDLTPVIEYQAAAMMFLDESLGGEEYFSRLKMNGPSSLGTEWLFRMDRYGCASNKGEWCIYCEKTNDVAVIGLRNSDGAAKFSKPLKKLYAHSIEAFLEMGSLAPVPFNVLVESWRHGLVQNYSNH